MAKGRRIYLVVAVFNRDPGLIAEAQVLVQLDADDSNKRTRKQSTEIREATRLMKTVPYLGRAYFSVAYISKEACQYVRNHLIACNIKEVTVVALNLKENAINPNLLPINLSDARARPRGGLPSRSNRDDAQPKEE